MRNKKVMSKKFPKSIIINGGNKLQGDLILQGDKTTAVHILFTAIFLNNICIEIENIPLCYDVLKIINWITKKKIAKIDFLDNSIKMIPESVYHIKDITEINSIRSSICMLIPLTLLNKKVVFSKIGGCNFIERPIDRHLELAKAFGIEISENKSEYISHHRMHDMTSEIQFDCSVNNVFSVGLTCHAILGSIFFKGDISLINVATEPTIISVLELIGKKKEVIFFKEERKIKIRERVINQKDIKCKINLPLDISVLITYLCAVAPLGGKIKVINDFSLPNEVKDLLNNFNIKIKKDSNQNSLFYVDGLITPQKRIICSPFPGIPTDSSPMLSLLCSTLEEPCCIVDKVYLERSTHISSLKNMGFNIWNEKNIIFTNGCNLNNENLKEEALDIRQGATILIGALLRKGETVIDDFHQVNRGYDGLIENFQRLGADIKILEYYE